MESLTIRSETYSAARYLGLQYFIGFARYSVHSCIGDVSEIIIWIAVVRSRVVSEYGVYLSLYLSRKYSFRG